MNYMVILVVDDPDRCDSVLDAWDAAGARGVTILESTGLARMKRAAQRDDMPLIPSMARLLSVREERHRTLFSVVQGEEMVEKLSAAAQAVLGDLSQPHTGFLFAVPVSHVVGLSAED
ncbi:MAG: hypothetical protein D6803_07725 [Anaerolineae bacterium]|nr:MAG: hypothetical protein D6803_07725 [Anaerolineae bacterium]